VNDIILNFKLKEDSARPSILHEQQGKIILTKLNIKSKQSAIDILTYFSRYGYVPVTSQTISEAAKMLGSAPWIGFEGNILEPVITELLDSNVLVFRKVKELDDQIVLQFTTER
jgi:hypothetical protein